MTTQQTAARLDPGYQPQQVQHPASTWDWQRELENYCSRASRGRAEEANAFRRSAEEAERSALRRIEDVERQMLRSQAEEVNLLQNFLSGWNGFFEARLERQSQQCMARIEEVERRSHEEAELLRREVSANQELVVEARRIGEVVSENIQDLPKRFDEFRRDVQSQVAVELETEHARTKEIAEALRREIVGKAEATALQMQQSATGLVSRMEALEGSTGASLQKLATLESSLNNVAALAARIPPLESVQLEVDEKLRQVHQGLTSGLEKQSSEVANLKWQVDSHHSGLREAMEAAEKRHGESSTGIYDEVRALRGHCDTRIEAQARVTAETCKRLEGGFREMIDDATERAELAAANLDSKVAGALDAVMDARVAKGTKECTDEARAAAAALEVRLRSSEAFTERVLREELQQAKSTDQVQLTAEMAALRDELHHKLQESSEDLRAVTADCGQLSQDVKKLQSQGATHEWCIPRCLHRIRYLAMSDEAGLWLDSDPFSLGGLGPVTMRFFPHGTRAGDGQCAVALRMTKEAAAACGIFLVPAVVDLSVANLRSRVAQRPEEGGTGGIQWLADGLGHVETHCGKGADDLRVRVEVPGTQAVHQTSMFTDPAAGVEQLLTAGVAEDLTVPQELKNALQQRRATDAENGVSTAAMVSSSVSPDEFRSVDGIGGATLLSQDTLVPDDVASTVTAGSDAGGSPGTNLGSRLRSFWKRDAPIREAGIASRTEPGAASPQPMSAAPAASGVSGALPTTLAGAATPAAAAAVAAAAATPSAGPSGVFGIQNSWTRFQDGKAADSVTARPVTRPTGLSSASPFAPAARGPPISSRTKNPFEVTNPFESGFTGEGGPLPGSPTPSFATVSTAPLQAGDPIAGMVSGQTSAQPLGAANPAGSPKTKPLGVPGRLEAGGVNPI